MTGHPTLPPTWTIVPFSPEHQAGIVALISGIQRGEFGLAITPQDQPDLMDIPGFYVNGANGPGGFWVGLDQGGAVAGCIALLNIGPDAQGQGQGALRKMFVRPDMRGAGMRGAGVRGSGLSARLLDTLFDWCAGHGVGQLYLGTTDRFLAAHRFYEKHGFTRLDKAALPPSFPVMAVDSVFYAKSLS